jgi:hypothetical protein
VDRSGALRELLRGPSGPLKHLLLLVAVGLETLAILVLGHLLASLLDQ